MVSNILGLKTILEDIIVPSKNQNKLHLISFSLDLGIKMLPLCTTNVVIVISTWASIRPNKGLDSRAMILKCLWRFVGNMVISHHITIPVYTYHSTDTAWCKSTNTPRCHYALTKYLHFSIYYSLPFKMYHQSLLGTCTCILVDYLILNGLYTKRSQKMSTSR